MPLPLSSTHPAEAFVFELEHLIERYESILTPADVAVALTMSCSAIVAGHCGEGSYNAIAGAYMTLAQKRHGAGRVES